MDGGVCKFKAYILSVYNIKCLPMTSAYTCVSVFSKTEKKKECESYVMLCPLDKKPEIFCVTTELTSSRFSGYKSVCENTRN